MRLVFLGSPAAAVTILDRVVEAGHDVASTWTQPDRPVGRKRLVTPCPVAARARELEIPVEQPARLKDPTARDLLEGVQAQVAVVVAYGRILPPALLEVPPRGFINVHFSLLPRHRGASPVAAAILAGDDRTGVSIMQLDAGLDTGPVLSTRGVEMFGLEGRSELTGHLAEVGAELLLEVLARLDRGEVLEMTDQDHESATLCRPLRREDGLIDWSRGAVDLDRQMRGLDPWPGVFTVLADKRLKILAAKLGDPEGSDVEARMGRIAAIEADEIVVTTGAGEWVLERVQPEGGKPMTGGELARGRRLRVGDRLG